MGLAGRFLSPRRPLLAWQVVSHKFIRPLVPFAMAGALAGNVLLVLLPFPAGSPRPLLTLPSPLGEALLLAQACFYAAAAAGNFLRIPGAAGRLLYLPTFLVNSNLAALLGLYGYLSGKSGVLWKRVERR